MAPVWECQANIPGVLLLKSLRPRLDVHQYAHPAQKFKSLCTTPIEWFDLAKTLFNKTYGKGVTAFEPGQVPPAVVDVEDATSGQKAALGSATAAIKRKSKVSKKDKEEIKPVVQSNPKPKVKDVHPIVNPTLSKPNAQAKALQLIAFMFLKELSTEKYIRFINVVQGKANTEFFVSLAAITNASVCKAWLRNRQSANVNHNI
ncbi:hypothetical protein KEM48_001526 [Puccinia striiformis f. sp. tritici PST-130]|nr:hypothetical protein KEM48_001526 [Puccinia striiformis f. sp. tritici PST-130]